MRKIVLTWDRGEWAKDVEDDIVEFLKVALRLIRRPEPDSAEVSGSKRRTGARRTGEWDGVVNE